MKESTFNVVVAKLQEGYELNRKTNELGISIIEITQGYAIAINALLMEAFSTDKVETLHWYLYEYRKGKMIISDSKTKKTLYDLDEKGDLWKYMND